MMRDFGFIWQLWSFDDKVMSKWPIYVNIPELKMQTETARCMKPFHRVHSTFHEHTSGYIQLFQMFVQIESFVVSHFCPSFSRWDMCIPAQETQRTRQKLSIAPDHNLYNQWFWRPIANGSGRRAMILDSKPSHDLNKTCSFKSLIPKFPALFQIVFKHVSHTYVH